MRKVFTIIWFRKKSAEIDVQNELLFGLFWANSTPSHIYAETHTSMRSACVIQDGRFHYDMQVGRCSRLYLRTRSAHRIVFHYLILQEKSVPMVFFVLGGPNSINPNGLPGKYLNGKWQKKRLDDPVALLNTCKTIRSLRHRSRVTNNIEAMNIFPQLNDNLFSLYLGTAHILTSHRRFNKLTQHPNANLLFKPLYELTLENFLNKEENSKQTDWS